MSPYESGIFHQVLFVQAGGHDDFADVHWVPGASSLTAVLSTTWPKSDITGNGPRLHSDGPANANALAKITYSVEAVSSRLFTSPRRKTRLDGAALSIAYLFNSFINTACFGRSASAFTNTAIVHAVSSAVTGSPFRATFAPALASYFSIYPRYYVSTSCITLQGRGGSEEQPKS